MASDTIHVTGVCDDGNHAKCPGKVADVEQWVFHNCNCICHLNQAMYARIERALGGEVTDADWAAGP